MLGFAYQAGLSAELFLDAQPTSQRPPSFQVADGTFNLQIQAVEVTQGVRGDIPARIAPDGDLVLPADGAVHIADRRTVVRVYPWVQTGGSVIVPPVTAHLWAYRDGELLPGSPISPLNLHAENITSGQPLAQMRGDAHRSWNFLLPAKWTTGDPDQNSFTLRFVVEANPAGPDQQAECQGCAADNQVILEGQQFVTVPPLVIQPYFVEHTLTERDGSLITFPAPDLQEYQAVMRAVHAMLPVGDIGQGLNILTPIDVEWQGLLYQNERHIFAEAMVDQYLPGGSLRGNQGGTIHLFVFSSDGKHRFLVNYNQDGMRLPLAWTGWPYAQSGARPLELVHELTHVIGLSHAGNGYGEATSNPDYPDPSGRVELNAYGFDVWNLQAIPPHSPAGETHDFMSYNSLDPAWISIYTWETIGNLLGQPNLDV
jgi:hypothetical protein